MVREGHLLTFYFLIVGQHLMSRMRKLYCKG
jgi:hypothetical protein